MTRTIIAAALALLLGDPTTANAQGSQDWPTRTVSMVVPFAPGGGVDTGGRIMAPHLSEILKQQVIVENVGGAGGVIGAAKVAKAPPDGYQFLLGHSGTHSYNPTLYKRLAYNAVTDFEPVSLVYGTSMVLFVGKDFPGNTLPAFIAHVKANRGKLQFGSAGAGSVSHIACLLLNSVAGLDVTHVPYRGVAPAMQDLIGGRIDYMCNPISVSMGQIEGGIVKPIALLSMHRYSLLPNLLTADEQGLKNFDADSWSAFFFPRGTPRAIVERLSRATSEVLDLPAVHQRYLEIGLRVPPPEQRTPEYLAKLIPADIAKWAGPIKASGVSVD